MNAIARDQIGAAATIVGYALRESLRRRVFAVVIVLTAGFLVLYAVGAHFAFRDARSFAGTQRILDPTAFTGATIFGLALFAILFLGAVLAVFLTLGVVRGDAESGLLQPLIVRPLGRRTMLLSRFAGAAGISAAYVLVVYLIALLITGIAGDWWPDHVVGPGLGLAAGRGRDLGDLAPGGGLPDRDRTGDRRPDDLRRGSHRRAAGSDRARAGLPCAEVDCQGRHLGAFRSKRSTRPACMHWSPTRRASPAWSSSSARSAARRRGASALVLWSAVYVALALALAVAAFSRRDL